MVVFGLDFGTTYSSVAVLKDGDVYMLKQQNSPYIPTFLFMHETTAKVSYGYDAETLYARNDVRGSFFRDLKRWVGCHSKNFTTFKDKLKPQYAVELVDVGKSDMATVKLGSYNYKGRYNFALPDLIASFVRCIIKDAEKCFMTECSGVICSVPAKYNSCQRSFMLECVTLSGYDCKHIINEPSAAAFSAASSLKPGDTFVLVYDFGGGTFDVSGVSVRNGTFGVRASGGDMNLGGRDVDRKFVEKLFEKASVTEVDYSIDVSSLKEKLSLTGTSIIYQLPTKDGFKKVEVTLSDLSEVVVPFVQRSINIMNDVYYKYVASVFSSAQSSTGSGRRKCVLQTVGGSSYLPGLKGMLSNVPYVERVLEVSDARFAIAAGCAMYSLCLTPDSPMLLIDCASHHLSIPSYKGESIVLVPAGAPIPFSGRRRISLMNATCNSSYKAVLFEGDYVKCPLNEKIYSSTVQLRELGETSTARRTSSITIELDVSSVGTVNFKIIGEKGAEVVIGKDRVFDFSLCHRPSREIADLFSRVKDRVVLSLSLTRTLNSRASLSLAEGNKLYNETRDLALVDLLKDYHPVPAIEVETCSTLLNVFVEKLLRGARVEKLAL
nr:HSP70h [Carrot closterovirus 2]